MKLKRKGKWNLVFMCICISFSLTGCTGSSSDREISAGETDPSENIPWVCGGVAWTGDWFTVWVSKEAAGRDMPVVAQIDKKHLKELQKLRGDMKIEVRLAAK